MARIKRLDVENFRGISRPIALIFNSRSVLLFGENGTCKSSFVDALEKLFTKRVSTLDSRAIGLSSDKHGPHIHAQTQPTISVAFDDSAQTVVDLATTYQKLPTAVRAYLEAGAQNLYILRRRQLLELIESQPRDRYELIRPFLPLGRVEAFEQGLRQAADDSERAASVALQRFDMRVRDLERAVAGSVSPDLAQEKVLSALSVKLVRLGIPTPAAFGELEEVSKRLAALLEPFGDVDRQNRLSAVSQALGEARSALERIDLGGLRETLVRLQDRQAREAAVFYEAVLEQGTRWIEEARLSQCPLCEQTIDAAETISQALQRLEAMREIVQLRREAATRRDLVRERVFAAVEALRRLKVRLRDAVLSYPEPQLAFVQHIEEALEDLHDALTQDIRSLSAETVRLYAEEFAGNAYDVHAARLEQHIAHEMARFPSAEGAREMLAAKESVDRVIDLWPQFTQERQELARRKMEATVARQLYEAAQTARKQEIQAFFDELSEEINRIFEHLNPDESHGGIKLEVREATQRSVSLRADFFDRKGEDPRAYYSEAHLDTLGLSIFLALRKWYRRVRPSFDLLILDDVMSSVDSAHALRLSELLLTEFKDYQMFVTTHDRIWFEHLWDIQARCGVSQNFVNKVIHKWTIEEGPDLREPEDERKALDRLIEDDSAEAIAGMAGRLLEHTLQEMRYALRLGVQAKRGELYEIGDLWPAFYSTVKREYPMLYDKARTVMDALDVGWPLRNWLGAHWNTWAKNVSRRTAVEFADAVRRLFDFVFCPECRRFISPSATPLGQLACRCGGKIYPAPGKAAVPPVGRDELVRATQGTLRSARLDTVRLLESRKSERKKER